MTIGIYSAVAGVTTSERELEIVANNIANAGSAGFKEQSLCFESVLSASERYAGASAGKLEPFVRQSELVTNFSQGTAISTGNPLDVAIEGEGFFVVQTPEGEELTRNGTFQISGEGQIVTSAGHVVAGAAGPIRVDGGAVSIGQDGTVMVEGEERGRLRIVVPDDPKKLTHKGQGLFAAGGAALSEAKEPRVIAGAYEGSNVDVVANLTNLIKIGRTSDSYQKALMLYARAQEKVSNEVGKLA